MMMTRASLLPSLGLLYCLIYPLAYDFRRVTATHCRAFNLLPSVSSAISFDFRTSIFWILCIGVHSPFRFMLAKQLYLTYNKYFATIYSVQYVATLDRKQYERFLLLRRLRFIAFQINRIEIIGLIILTIFPSHTNFELHKFGFLVYLTCAFIFKLLVCFIERRLQEENLPNCYRQRVVLATVFYTSFFIAIMAYYLHNKYCANYVYTVFGFFEIVLIFSNIAFHASSVLIIKDQYQLMQSISHVL